MLPPRLDPTTRWADREIARLNDEIRVAAHRHAELAVENVQLRRLLFEERACNNVVLGMESIFAADLEPLVG